MKESSELLLTSSPGSSLSIWEDHSHLGGPSLPVPCPHHSQFTEISCPWCSQQAKTTTWATQILIPTPLVAPENGDVALGEMGAGPGDGTRRWCLWNSQSSPWMSHLAEPGIAPTAWNPKSRQDLPAPDPHQLFLPHMYENIYFFAEEGPHFC